MVWSWSQSMNQERAMPELYVYVTTICPCVYTAVCILKFNYLQVELVQRPVMVGVMNMSTGFPTLI